MNTKIPQIRQCTYSPKLHKVTPNIISLLRDTSRNVFHTNQKSIPVALELIQIIHMELLCKNNLHHYLQLMS